MSIVVLIGIFYSLPFLVVSVLPDSNYSGLLNILVFSLGFCAIVFFLFPVHFGIKEGIHSSLINSRQDYDVTPSISLHEESVIINHSIPIDNLQILVLSDLHCDSGRQLNLIRESIKKLDSYDFDLLFILGDLTENKKYLRELFQVLKELNTSSGKFLVRGNHDYEGGRNRMIKQLAEEFSIRLLHDTTYDVEKFNITLVGTDRPWCRGTAVPKVSGLSIGLSHTPDNIKFFSKLGVPIVVAGHTHGGKIHLPFLGSILVPSLYGRFLDYGWFKYRDTSMYITRGFGYFPGVAGEKGEVLRLILNPRKNTT